MTPHPVLARLVHRLAGERPHPAPELVTTGYPSLDRLLAGGLRRGELAILGGDAGAGTTALALGIALRAAVAGHAVLVLSHEATPERLWERLLAAESGVTHLAMRSGVLTTGQATALRDAATVLAGLPLRIEVAPGGATALAARLDDDADVLPPLVIVDGLAGIDAPPRPVAEAQAQAVRAAKRAAVTRDAALLLTAPLLVNPAFRPPPRPALGDFAALGAIAQVADVVLAVHREGLHDDAPDVAGAFEVHALKHRFTRGAHADLYIEPAAGRVEDLA
jgi:replicative DNA helicase